MQYAGGKFRQSKVWAPIINSVIGTRPYVEPFVGGANMMVHIQAKRRIASDINGYLIAMWEAVQRGWQPPTDITEAEYNKIRVNMDKYPRELVGFAGFGVSFGGKWFNSFARNAEGKNYAESSARVIVEQMARMADVKFIDSSYEYLQIPKRAVVYCDPPYKATSKSCYINGERPFDHEKYYEWCRRIKRDYDAVVFASEYWMPEDFELVHSFTLLSTVSSKAESRPTQTDNLYLLS